MMPPMPIAVSPSPPPPRPPAIARGTSCANVVVLRTMTRFWQPHQSFPATATILVMGLPGEPRDRDLEFWGSQKRPVRVVGVGWVIQASPKKTWLMGCDGWRCPSSGPPLEGRSADVPRGCQRQAGTRRRMQTSSWL